MKSFHWFSSCPCDSHCSPEIIMQLRTPFQGEPLRPMLSDQLCEENINSLLKACWSENPDHRPPLGSIRRLLKDTSSDGSGQFLLQHKRDLKPSCIICYWKSKNEVFLMLCVVVMQIYWITWWTSWRNMQITWRRWWRTGPISWQ